MTMVGGNNQELSLDTWTALLAGSAPWTGGEAQSESWGRLLCFGQLLLAGTALVILFAASDHSGPKFTTSSILVICAFSALLIQPLMRLMGLAPRPRGVWVNLAARLTLLILAWLSVYSLLPGWNVLWSAPVATVLGLDALNTCTELGWRPRTATWYRQFLLSGFHLGMVGALIAVKVSAGSRQTEASLQIYAGIHAWVAVAAGTLWAVSVLQRSDMEERARVTSMALQTERRARAHWLHDDVCAQLRLVSLKLQTTDAGKDEIVRLLNDFDHHLRLNQLDELLGTGFVRIAEVLQPFIRHAQNHSVHIEGVPDFERAAMALPEAQARLAARAAGVLTSNALNAGATVISYGVSTQDDELRLSIADNGPGFSMADIPAGRGLRTLMDDLHPGGLSVESLPNGGSTVTATIPIRERMPNGNNSTRR